MELKREHMLRDIATTPTDSAELRNWKELLMEVLEELDEVRENVDAITEERDRLRGLVVDAVDMVESFKWLSMRHNDMWRDEDRRVIREWLEGARAWHRYVGIRGCVCSDGWRGCRGKCSASQADTRARGTSAIGRTLTRSRV